MKGNALILRDLSKGNPWCDKDQVMLFACFQLLVDFLEKEKPQAHVDYQHDKAQRKQWKELQALYRYWKRDRPKLELQIRALTAKWARSRKTKRVPGPMPLTVQEIVLNEDRRTWNFLRAAEERSQKLEEEMLGRLIASRRHLWC